MPASVPSKYTPVSVPVPSQPAVTSPTIEVQSYSPDTGFCTENTKVIIVLKGQPAKDCSYSCMFDQTEVPANVSYFIIG